MITFDAGACPICGKELVKVYEHVGPMGTEESMYECPGHYYEQYAYGSTELVVGDFMTGYHHTTPGEEVSRINALVYQVGALYKGKYGKAAEIVPDKVTEEDFI